jgi:hypothetical protein
MHTSTFASLPQPTLCTSSNRCAWEFPSHCSVTSRHLALTWGNPDAVLLGASWQQTHFGAGEGLVKLLLELGNG